MASKPTPTEIVIRSEELETPSKHSCGGRWIGIRIGKDRTAVVHYCHEAGTTLIFHPHNRGLGVALDEWIDSLQQVAAGIKPN